MYKTQNLDRRVRKTISNPWKILLGLQLTILLLATIVLGLCGHILAASSTGSEITIYAAVNGSRTVTSFLFPADLSTGPTWAITATGIGGTADALLVLLILVFARPPAVRVARKRLMFPLFIILFVSVVRSVIAVSYGWSQDQSPSLNVAEWARQSRDSAVWGSFTPYGWSKQAREYVVEAWARSRLVTICREVQATWALGLIIAVLDIVALGTGFWLWKAARRELGRTS